MVAVKKFRHTVCTIIFGICLFSSAEQSLGETMLLEFSSASCGPCREMRPTVQRLASAGYDVRHVDIAQEPELASRFRVDRVPTYIALKDGRETARLVGTTSLEQLQEMLGPRAERSDNVRSQSPDQFRDASGTTLAEGQQTPPPQHARQRKSPAREPLDSPGSNTRNQAPRDRSPQNPFTTSSTAEAQSSPDQRRLLEATVKLAVDDASGTSAGTGTIVDAREGAALILTCGHIFRTSEGKGSIEVTLFQATPNGAVVRETLAGQVMHYDLEYDLAVVIIRPEFAVSPLPVAPSGTHLQEGAAVATVGCDHGANPTVISSKITAVDRYQGPPNVEVAGAPVEGRSGGGLFNSSGQLVGVCFAADPQGNEGLYASLPAIHEKLDRLNLSMVYNSPSGPTPPSTNKPEQTVSVDSNPPARQEAIRGQEPFSPEVPLNSFADTNPLSPAEQATLEELGRRSVESEVVCIIRPHDPEGKSEVITLNGASPAFVRSLTQLKSEGTVSTAERRSAKSAAGELLR